MGGRMRVWALSDLHLSLGSDKPMDIFGAHWARHHRTMAEHWDALVAEEDLVLSPGDFSWASKPHEVAADFAWLAERPGHKVLIKGNHDHWWPKTKTRLQALLPPRTWALKKNACRIGQVAIFGARGGDFAPLTRYGDTRSPAEIDAALEREERELRLSIAQSQELERREGPPRLRICCFHYPPLPPGEDASRFTELIAAAGADYCVYGHLHGAEAHAARFEGSLDGVEYRCASADLIDFRPILLADLEQGT